jgi:hypothetical protein
MKRRLLLIVAISGDRFAVADDNVGPLIYGLAPKLPGGVLDAECMCPASAGHAGASRNTTSTRQMMTGRSLSRDSVESTR